MVQKDGGNHPREENYENNKEAEKSKEIEGSNTSDVAIGDLIQGIRRVGQSIRDFTVTSETVGGTTHLSVRAQRASQELT